jgi:hypothetical protein
MSDVRQFMARANGQRSAGFSVGNVEVLLTANDAERNDAVLTLATKLARATDEIGDLEARNERQSSIIDRMRSERDAAVDRVAASLDGKRRFFSEVVMRPEKRGDWSGAVVLLDPRRLEHGHAIWFASTRDVRLAHPELWPVGTNEHGDVVLDAWGHR